MDLIVVATPQEIQPFLAEECGLAGYRTLVTGAGCVESTLSLSRFLATSSRSEISRVIHVGVAGAYLDTGIQLLDICLAEEEIFADFAIVTGTHLEPLRFPGAPETVITFDESLLTACTQRLLAANLNPKRGRFLTVNSVSGTASRGAALRDAHQAICENMEGFAVARVCQAFAVPLLEIRCISNFVEDRNRDGWRLSEACAALAEAVTAVIACR